MPGTPACCACRCCCLKLFIFTSESQLAVQFTPLLMFLHSQAPVSWAAHDRALVATETRAGSGTEEQGRVVPIKQTQGTQPISTLVPG